MINLLSLLKKLVDIITFLSSDAGKYSKQCECMLDQCEELLKQCRMEIKAFKNIKQGDK